MTTDHQSPDPAVPHVPRSIGALFAAQVRAQGHRPYLTFYDDATEERTELSYATFDNWASKAANLLTEEIGAGTGSRVGLLATGHWTAAVMAVATWKIGGVVVAGAVAPDDVAVLFVGEPDAHDRAAHPGLIVLGAGLGGRVESGTPGIGFGNEVLAFADDYDDPAVGLDMAALASGTGDRTQGELLRDGSGMLGADRRAASTALLGPSTAAPLLLAPALVGASLVWCPGSTADLQARFVAERVTDELLDDGSVRAL